MTARRLFLLGFAVALLTAFGCSNSDDGGTSAPSLTCTDDGTPATNTVVLSCGGSSDDVSEQIGVVITGPAAGSTTLRGLNFDVTYDPTKVTFAPSASYTSPLFPNALVAVTLFNGQQGRVVVSIQQPGGLPAVSVAPGPHDVLGLTFSRATGAAFNPSALLFANSEATASSAPIAFTNGLALSYL